MDENLLITTFCLVDDFCNQFEPEWKASKKSHLLPGGDTRRKRSPQMCLSEIMTIVICFHASGYRTFKDYYTRLVAAHYVKYFPNLLSYSRFVYLMKEAMFPLFIFLQGCLGQNTDISFIDSTMLTVCHTRRIYSHQVFEGLAKRGKTSTGWFFGFKLHLVINHIGEILSFQLTSGNIDDRKPVPYLVEKLSGKVFGDRGYISQGLFKELWEKGVQLITRLKKNMKNKLMPFADMLLLRRRGLIESVHNRLKNGCQIEHHRHRNPQNFLVNLFGGLTVYSLDPNKPTLLKHDDDRLLLTQLTAV